MSEKQFVQRFFMLCILCIGIIVAIVVICDPLFHYHAPMWNFTYYIGNQRYQNDGISRHFEYDAIITGNSMTENFKSSEFDQLFGVNSIKTPFAGATYKEINDYVERAIVYNDNLEVVLRALDLDCMALEKDNMALDSYPEYLYDDNLINDVNYVLNKSILLYYTVGYCLIPTVRNKPTTTFDEYARWHETAIFQKESVLAHYIRPEKVEGEVSSLTEERKQIIYDNVEQNVLAIAKENPQIEFYYFYPPYSIAHFDYGNQLNKLEERIEIMEYATSLIVEIDNIKLYSFFHEYDLITNLDRYRDIVHYDGDVNSYLLECMQEGSGLITLDNYEEYFEEIREFYGNYDYEGIFER
ncbi:MAG: hypothetical protein R3Y54_09100 [Eubacteriales bacterium]